MMPFRFERAFLGATIVLTLVCLSYFASLLDLAPELSDASYYIINIAQADQVTNQLSMFGILWHSLFGDLSLVTHRIVHFALIFLSGVAFGWSYTPADLSPQIRAGASLLSGSAALSVLFWVLLEPNYNTMALITFMLACICARPFLDPLDDQSARTASSMALTAMGFGAAMLALALTKITAAAAVGAFWLLAYWAVHGAALTTTDQRIRVLRSFGRLALFSALGFLPVFALLALHGFGPIDLWARFNAGRESVALLSSHDLGPAFIWDQAVTHAGFLTGALRNHAAFVALLTGTIALGSIALFIRHVLLRAAASLTAVICLWLLATQLPGLSASAHLELFAILRTAALAVAVILLWTRRSQAHTLVLLAAALLGPFLLSVGTNNSWHAQFSLYSGLVFVASAVTFAAATRPSQKVLAPGLALIFVCLAMTVWNTMQRFPYRMGGPLTTAQVAISYGPQALALRTTPALARAYAPLEGLRTDPALQQDTPVFIDLTGRAPGVGAYLDLDPPSVAWPLGGYPGSDAYFEYALEKTSPERLRQAWLLVPDPDHAAYTGLDADILLRALGRSGALLESYEPVADTFIPYMSLPATLYRPKN